MNKKSVVAILTTAALLSSSLGAITASAASYTVGVKQDFETAVTLGHPQATLGKDANYGGVLNLSGGPTEWFNFNTPVSGGKYVWSFDAKMNDASDKSLFGVWVKDASGAQSSFIALRSGAVCTYDSAAWSFAPIGNSSYSAGDWQKYDIVFNFDEAYADVYVDGAYVGEINIGFDGISAIALTYNDWTEQNIDAQVDNFNFYAASTTAEMTASYTYKGKYEVNFSETMKDLDANDFTLTRVPTGGGAEETVLFDVDFMSTDKVVITPASTDSGYTYTLAYADKKTAFGNSVTGRTYTHTLTKTDINFAYDFDTTGSASGNTTVQEAQYRGKYLKYTGAQDYNFKPGTPLTNGKYIFSYDVQMDTASGGYFLVRTYNSTTWDNYQAVWDNDRRFGDFTQNRGWGCTGYGASMAAGDWHRVDNIMDLDAKKSYVYLDGEYLSSADLSVRIPTGDAFNGAMISFSGTTGSVDNLRIKTVNNNYDAKLSVKGDLIYIDFDETTYLEDGDYSVTVSNNPLATAGDAVNATLVYNGGARAVLKLDEELSAGETVAVSLNGVKSFLGTSLKNDVLTASVPVQKTTVTVVNDDMSTYATDVTLDKVGTWTNSFDAENKSPLEGKPAYLYKDSTNGMAVTLSDSLTTYTFDEVSGGTATIEIDASELVKTAQLSASTTQALHRIMFVDQDGNNWEWAVPYVRSNNWIGDNKISFGNTWDNLKDLTDEMKLKMVYDFKTSKATFYYNGELARNACSPMCSSNNKLSTDSITGIKGIAVRASGSTELQLGISNIKVTHTSTPSAIGDISFKDVLGNNVSLSDLKSTIREMNIVFPDGLKNDSAEGIVKINNGDFTAYDVTYNKTTKTATITFAEMLGANKSYTVAVKGAKTAEGDSYIDMESSFTTTSAVTEVSNLGITRNGTDITVSADFVNTASDKDYVMIYAAYDGYELVKMDFVPVNAVKDCVDTEQSHTFTGADSASYTKVTAFVWDSFAKMCPATRSVTK